LQTRLCQSEPVPVASLLLRAADWCEREGLVAEAVDYALAAIQEGEAGLGEPPSPLARAELLALKARILLRLEALAEAAQCVEQAVHLAGRDRGQTGELVAIAACRVHLARCTPGKAVAHLTRSLVDAERSGRLGTALELLILRSLAFARQGERQAAQADLERALTLAEPEGYVRLFVDEGAPMAALLQELRKRWEMVELKGVSAASRGYVDHLLSSFARPHTQHAAPPITTSLLIEPLSERELQVLRLMAEGLTNKEIAARLIIALGTVKAHIHHISSKLGAQNRAHAVARAKELGLL
jgi:LuxR family maltose regulon positive regulatory protein